MLFNKLRRLMAEPHGAEAVSLREGSAEFEFFMATLELARCENLAHGFSHLGELLSYDPNRPEWLAMADAYIDMADGNEEVLIEPGSATYFAVAALRARLLARAGDFQGAVELIIAVSRARSDLAYLDWALDWLEPEGAAEALGHDAVLGLLVAVTGAFADFDRLPHRRRLAASRFADLALRLHKAFELEPSEVMLVAGTLRRAGRFDEGVAVARAAYEAEPSWGAAIGEGLILRAQGRVTEAEATFRRALTHDPHDVSALLETGDMYFDIYEWTRAKSVYDEVLAAQPGHPWAEPSALYCEWQVTEDMPFPVRLRQLRDGDPQNSRARALMARHQRYDGFLPESADATANAICRIIEDIAPDTDDGQGGSIAIAVSSLEAPSNRIAFDIATRAAKRASQISLSYNAEYPEPDPREPVEPIAVELWKREGEGLIVAVPAPPESIAERIAELARAPYEPSKLWASASALASELGESAMESIVACAVHPRLPADPYDATAWLGRVQLAVAMVTAQLGTGWDDSPRRQGLYSMLLGPRDWTTTAAIIAATRLADDEPALSLDIGEAFQRLADADPGFGHWDYRDALYWHWRDLPHLSDDERSAIHCKLVALHEDEPA